MGPDVENYDEPEQGAKASRVGVDPLVMRFRWLNPWGTVKWVYCERDRHGLRVMRKEGRTRMWKAVIGWIGVKACDKCLMWLGMEYPASDFFILGA